MEEMKEPTAMAEALQNVIVAMMVLSEVWNEEEVKNYPKYLPDFDEFILEFNRILDEEE